MFRSRKYIKNNLLRRYLLKVLLGMYTFPDGVRTRQEGSKSSFGAEGCAAKRPLCLLIVGFLGGTSGGREALSRRQPVTKYIIYI